MTGEPEDVPALALVDMADIKQGGYRAYPLVDHVADKVAATIERHGSGGMPSTRFRDLVDLVAIARGASVDATAQAAALTSEARRRGLALPDRFDVPDRQMWEEGYRAPAHNSAHASSTHQPPSHLQPVSPIGSCSEKASVGASGSQPPRASGFAKGMGSRWTHVSDATASRRIMVFQTR